MRRAAEDYVKPSVFSAGQFREESSSAARCRYFAGDHALAAEGF